MRINSPGISGDSAGKLSIQSTVSPQVSAHLRPAQSSGESLSYYLTDIYSHKSVEIPHSQILALETELTAIGMTASDLNADSALRALILHRNGIPLSPELLGDGFEGEAAILSKLGDLRELAGVLLADKSITGENRTLLGILISDIDSIFKADTAQQAMKNGLEDSVLSWLRSLESHIQSIINSDPEALADILRTGGEGISFRQDDARLLHMSAGNNPRLAALLSDVENAAGEIISRIQGIQAESREVSDQIMQAVNLLRNRISVISAEIEGLVQGGGRALQEGMIAGFFSEQVRSLERKLLKQLTVTPGNRIIGGEWSDSGEALPVRNMVRANGMAFEWRLLAWYRSGRDPRRLHDLIHRDVKGILNGFTAGLKTGKAGRRVKKMLGEIEKDAKSLVDSITRRQISTILQNRDDRSGLFFELPFGDTSGKGHAGIWARGRKKPDENTIDPDTADITFDVDTTGLGRLYVTMTIREKTVSLRFFLRDGRAMNIAHEMQTELTDSLSARGFKVGSVSFAVHEEVTGRRRSGSQKRSMDITG